MTCLKLILPFDDKDGEPSIELTGAYRFKRHHIKLFGEDRFPTDSVYHYLADHIWASLTRDDHWLRNDKSNACKRLRNKSRALMPHLRARDLARGLRTLGIELEAGGFRYRLGEEFTSVKVSPQVFEHPKVDEYIFNQLRKTLEDHGFPTREELPLPEMSEINGISWQMKP